MTFEEHQKKLEQIDYHIRTQSAGSSHQFSKKLNISRSTFFKYCECLKELGAETFFDKNANTYKYKHPGKLKLLRFEPIENEDMKKISGGKNILLFFNSPKFSDSNRLNLPRDSVHKIGLLNNPDYK
jgi:hypothetical protein